jgi:flagellar hook-associated protein 3 FlgL
MAMRVTNNVMTDRVLQDLRRNYAELASTQRQISSGRRVERISDDPLAASQARLRESDLEGLERQKAGADAATSWLNGSDTALGRLSDILARARELTVQGANGSLSSVDRNRIAAEIEQLAEASKDALNVRIGDAYIFSGTTTTTSPYAAGTADAYQGNAGNVAREVGPGVTIPLNPTVPTIPSPGTAPLTAQALLGGGQAAGDGRVLDVLRDLAQHMRSGTDADLALVRGADMRALDANMKAVIDARASVAGVQNRVDVAVDRLGDLKQASEIVLDDLVGVDLTEALINLTAQETAYQAALRAGANIIQPSLMDFLR